MNNKEIYLLIIYYIIILIFIWIFTNIDTWNAIINTITYPLR